MSVLLTRVSGWNQASKESFLRGVVREAISSMVRANAHFQGCLGAGESSSSVARCLLGDQCLVSSGPSACNTASVSSKSYNKLLSVLAGNGWKNPSVVGKHEAGYGIQPCRELLCWQAFRGVGVHEEGPRATQGCSPMPGVSGAVLHARANGWKGWNGTCLVCPTIQL